MHRLIFIFTIFLFCSSFLPSGKTDFCFSGVGGHLKRVTKKVIGYGPEGDSTRANMVSVIEYDSAGRIVEEDEYPGYWTRGSYEYGLEKSGYWEYAEHTYEDEAPDKTYYFYNAKGYCDSVRFLNSKKQFCVRWQYHDSTGRYLGFDGSGGNLMNYVMCHERVLYDSAGRIFKDYNWNERFPYVDSTCYITVNGTRSLWQLGGERFIWHKAIDTHDSIISQTTFDRGASGNFEKEDSVYYERDVAGRLLKQTNFFNAEIAPKVKWVKGDFTTYSYDASFRLIFIRMVISQSSYVQNTRIRNMNMMGTEGW